MAVLFSVPARAIDYALFVGGRQVVGNDSTFNVTKDGKIKYDPRSRTLTLRGAVIRDTLCGIHNAGIDSLTILVEGTDSIFATGADGLRLERRTFIRSTGHDGRLCIGVSKRNKKDSIADFAALRLTGRSTLRISDCYMVMSSEGWALKGDGQDSLAIVTAEVTALTKDTLRSCMEGFRAVTLRSVITNGGEAYDTKTRTLNQWGSTKKAQQTLIMGCLYLGRYIVDVERRDTVAQTITAAATGLKKGRMKYDGRYHMLTLDSATVQATGCPAIRNVSISGMTIGIMGPVTITATGSDVLSLLVATTIRGMGNVAPVLSVKGSAGGIYQGGNPYWSTLTLSDITMDVDAVTRGIYGDGKLSQLSIDNARMRVFCSSAAGTNFRAVSSFAGCTMRNADSANGTAWRQATGSFDLNNGTTAREVVIDVPTTYYPVSIVGHSVNNVNMANFAADGVEGTGTVSLDASTKTLSLKDIVIRNVPYTGNYYTDAVYISEPEFTIHVSGTNSITHESGIVAKYGGTLTGPGTLTIEATDGSAIYTGSQDPFTIACARLTAHGREYGFNAASRGSLTLAAAAGQTATTHAFSGGYGNISTPELLLDGMNFYSPACCYFQNGSIRQNGGREVSGEVTFHQVTTRYGVKIMGAEIDNCSIHGLGSPYFNRADFMTFDEATRTLTLNNFDVSSSDETMNIIDISGDGIQLVANGDCNITTVAGAAIKVANTTGKKASLTFRGNGTFNVQGKFFSVLVGANGNVTFADDIVFNGVGAISGNNYGTKGETLTVKDNAYVVCSGQFDNPGAEQFSRISVEGDGQQIVVPNWGTAKKFDNGIAVADRNGEVAKGTVILGRPQSYGMYIGEALVSNANETDIDGKGQFAYDPATKTLTLKSANFDDTTGLRGGGIENHKVEGLTILLTGDNTLTTRNNGIYAEGSVTITGEGTLNVVSKNNTALWLFGADCTVSGPKVSLKGKNHAIHGERRNETLHVQNTATELTLRTEGFGTLSGIGALLLDQGLYITSPWQAFFDDTYGGVAVGNSLYSGTIIISNREPSNGIGDAVMDNGGMAEAFYDTAGRRLQQQQRGLNIIRMSDGTTRKIVGAKK